MNTKLKGRHFISLRDYAKEDLETILEVAFDLKAKVARRESHPLLAGKSLGMAYFIPSVRTRISFETGMTQLGGHAQYYTFADLQAGATAGVRETWVDVAQVVSRYLDGFLIRPISNPRIPEIADLKWGEAHAITRTIAENATIPIINGADDMEHPCQVMADIMTLIEKFGPDYKKKKVVITWAPKSWGVYPGVPHSMLIAGATLGMRLTFAYPKDGFDLDPGYIADAKRLAKQSGASIETVHDQDEAVTDADVIYVKGYGATTKTAEEYSKMLPSLMDWCVNKEDFDRAAPGAIFMTPMPVTREKEATSEVVGGPMSVIYDQAENRLHVQKAIMSLIM